MVSGTVVVVCTGNVCRSPYIEFRLRQMLGDIDIDISSAGTNALIGDEIDPGSAALLEDRGIDCSRFVAKQLTPELVREADLLLTATRKHRAEVALTDPSGLRKAMALGDFSDLVRDMPLEVPKPSFMDRSDLSPLALVVSAVSRRREHVPPRSDRDVDIPDPFRQEIRVFEQMEQTVDAFLPPVVRVLLSVESLMGL